MNLSCCRLSSSFAAVLLTAAALTVTGCSFDATQTPSSASSEAISGTIHGGPNPVMGATVKLYATTTVASPGSSNNYGYGQAGNLLATTTTSSTGAFSFTFGSYTCPAGQQAYITAAGGNTGANSANSASLLMAAIGPCSGLSAGTAIWIDEPSTIAAAYALSGFMTVSGTTVNISAPANNNATTPACSGTGASMTCSSAGLAHAFLNAANLVHSSNISGIDSTSPTGLAYSTLTSNAKGVVPQSTIHALANAVEACTNSSGAGSTACTTLMTDTTPPVALDAASATPTTTLQAMLELAQYPQPGMASAIFNIGSSIGYYSPALSATPTDWTLAIKYTGSGTTNFAAPWHVTTDISDNVYVADDTGNMSIFSLSSDGAPNWVTPDVNGSNAIVASSSGDGLALITDAVNGYVYAPEDGFLYQLNSSTGAVSQSIAAPAGGNLFAGAVDKNGNVFITGFTANPGLQELPVSGSTLTTVNVGGAAVPAGLRYVYLDPSGNIWTGKGQSNPAALYYAANTGTTAAPAYANAAVTVSGVTGSGSEGVEGVPMIDTLGNVWISTDQNLYEIVGGQSSVPGGTASIPAATLITPDSGVIRYARMDGNNNIFFGAASTGAGFLSIYYTVNTAGAASNANIQMNPCNVGAATSCGTSYALVNVVRGVAVDSTGSVWAAVVASDNVLQILGVGGPSWSQASYAKVGRPY
jgi:hypothetical protein